MINKLKIKNFKRFEDVEILFNNLTIIVGPNGAGKSTIIQSLLLLRQNENSKNHNLPITFNGRYVNLGSWNDVLCEYSSSDKIDFELVENNNPHFDFRFEMYRTSLQYSSTLNTPSILTNDKFQYIKAERIGPKRFYNTDTEFALGGDKIDSLGEYAIKFLLDKANDTISLNSDIFLGGTGQLLETVERWLQLIAKDIKIDIVSMPNIDAVSLNYRYAQTSVGLSKSYKANNVGFGITYILPILVSVLSANSESTIILENPEAHLHPRAQFYLGNLFALAAQSGVQIIIETHSPILVKGISKAIHDQSLLHHKANIFSVGYESTEKISFNHDGLMQGNYPRDFDIYFSGDF
jgi:predicted ATPase